VSTAVLAFGGLRVLAEAAPGHLEWLEEFLGPAFERADGHEAHWRVSLVEDRERYRQALDRGAADGTLEAFAFDAKVVGLARWCTGSADIGLFDAERGLLFEVTYASRTVTVLTEPGNAHDRVALMRVVRELVTNRAQRRGGLLLHAAAMAVGDRGIVITGPKGAGKTSLLIHALRARSARYVSNDRVVVPDANGQPSAGGVPTIVSLRRGMLDLFPSVATRAAASGYAYNLTLEEARAAGPRAADPRGKPDSLSPAQLCRLLDVRPLACSEIAAIVFPRITGESGTFALRRLTEAEVVEEIPDMLFGVRGGRFTSGVFVDPDDQPPPDLDAVAERCRGIASRLPCIECRLGLEAFGEARAADDLIEAILRL
jgi:hypothetical protein